jgi:hypothetical protein
VKPQVTHAATMNGTIHGELTPWEPLTPEEEIARLLRLLDGTDRYSLGLWAIPPDKPFDRVDLRKYPQEYIQTAGTPHRMTVEVHRIVDGKVRHDVLGRPVDDPRTLTEEIVAWDGIKTPVKSNEVFAVDEVIDLFVHYYRTGDAPAWCTRRLLDL